MDWHAYAIQVEGELKTADENNNSLKQEVRDLRKKLIEAKPNTEVQQQLANLQEEATACKDASWKRITELQQQLDAVKKARDAAVDQAAEAEKRQRSILSELDRTYAALKQERAETETLKKRLADRVRELQQVRQLQAKPTAGAVSYQNRIAVLERQLKLCQRENAKLQSLSDRNPDKPYADDSDDSEPDYPSPQAAPAKKEPRSTNLLAEANRPANYYTNTNSTDGSKAAAAVPKPAAASTPTACPKPAVASKPAATPRPAVAAKTDSSKKAPTISLVLSDDEKHPVTNSSAKAVGSARIQVRTSIHGNITVADHSPQPASTTKIATSSSPPPVIFSASKGATTSTPSKKRRSSPQPPAPLAKRRRNKLQEMQDEVSNLTINAHGFEDPRTPRSRRKESYQEDSDEEDDELGDETFESSMNFKFKAVCTYDNHGSIDSLFTSEELGDCVEALWERIRQVQDKWEHKCGEDWQYEFTKKSSNAGTPVCVTQKCLKLRTKWGVGQVAGKYACVDCASAGKPCFTYVKEGRKKGEFRLLPLREVDRTKAVTEGLETRYWINDGKGGVRGGGEEMEL